MKIADGTYVDKQGKQKPRITTQGWSLLVEWKDGSTSWIALKDLKESFPIKVAEYAVANKLTEEPAFKWWVVETLCKRHRIIQKVKCDLLPSSERSRSGVSLGGWVVHDRSRRSKHTNPGEQYAILSAMAFCVRSVSGVGRWVMRTMLSRCFPFDKPWRFVTLTIDDRQECR
jgi:hypothetical protein